MTESPFEQTPPQPPPWAPDPEPQPAERPRPAREPVFNAPWQAVAVVVLIVGGYAVQTLFPVDAVLAAYAFAPIDLTPARWPTVITSIFLHGGWAHAMMNGAFALAFSAPVARLFGPKIEGALLFFGFYLLCGVLANLGYAAVHPHGQVLVVGASGAVSGLMGAAARLIGGEGRVGPVFSRTVLGMGGGWIVINLIIAVFGGSFMPGAGNAGVAWEAHIAGFIVGALLIAPFARLAPAPDIGP
ncbi:rhomboid family intramembrane serine protease [Phenylobacterium sp.]|uniref:rhomboid family intramembrane serine protease n=1 Tax=Phenylobacterium sp. TaxID=1871053 RepID=UPI00120E2BFF|nr:rhomboid family intramembrane serine protease [Phenylobacterium sp.]THD59320.1 MAG: rhomboid family intramembrane serine protease [Phenylobacterium sp.]